MKNFKQNEMKNQSIHMNDTPITNRREPGFSIYLPSFEMRGLMLVYNSLFVYGPKVSSNASSFSEEVVDQGDQRIVLFILALSLISNAELI